MIDYNYIIFANAYLWAFIQYIWKCWCLGSGTILGFISDLIFDDNLIDNKRLATLGDDELTKVHDALVASHSAMFQIRWNFAALMEIIYSSEFKYQLNFYYNEEIFKKFNIFWSFFYLHIGVINHLDILLGSLSNDFYLFLYQLGEMYVPNWWWRRIIYQLVPLTLDDMNLFASHLIALNDHLMNFITFCENIQNGVYMSPDEAMVDFANLIKELKQDLTYFRSTTFVRDIVRCDELYIIYKARMGIRNTSFLYWLRATHKKAHPYLL